LVCTSVESNGNLAGMRNSQSISSRPLPLQTVDSLIRCVYNGLDHFKSILLVYALRHPECTIQVVLDLGVLYEFVKQALSFVNIGAVT